MTPEPIPSIFEEAKVISLRPGDVIVFRCKERLSDAMHANAEAVLNKTFGEHEILICDGGQDVAIVRPELGFWARLFGRRGSRG